MWKINAKILLSKITLITNFMCDYSKNKKTFSELVEIFRRCKSRFTSETDLSDDLRISKFIKDMKNGQWVGPIIIHSENGEVKDGVHRGIAYLTCVSDRVEAKNLPEIFIDEPVFDLK